MLEISRAVASMSTTGLAVLAAGLIARRSLLASGSFTDRAISLGRVFVAAPLATFGALHLSEAPGLKSMVPGYVPWPLFWVYLVGFALIATAFSLIFNRFVFWSGLLAGGMFLAFVAMMDLPAVIMGRHDRFAFALLARETTFGCSMLALACSQAPQGSPWQKLVKPCCIVAALVAIFYGVEHLLHPEFLPGVPLRKLTPSWVPVPRLWGYLVGAVLVASGVFLAINIKARAAAAGLGMVLAATVAVIYVPMLGTAHGTAAVVEVINYIGDTLLYAGTVLIVGEALSHRRAGLQGNAAPSN